MKATAIVLTIAGSDSGGGAGIQADLKTFSALGVYGTSVITALTAQNTLAVRGVFSVPPEFIRLQIDTVFDDLRPRAVKTGMLDRAEVVETVAAALEYWGPVPLVVDPVMVAKSGDLLLQEHAIDAVRRRLIPLATVLTPNLPEAAVLLAKSVREVEQHPQEAAMALLALGPKAVLLKGGHGSGSKSIDWYASSAIQEPIEVPRIATKNTHGTGCTLSAAICAFLAQAHNELQAVRAAKQYLHQAIQAADSLAVGSGHGPVHHFHAVWADLNSR